MNKEKQNTGGGRGEKSTVNSVLKKKWVSSCSNMDFAVFEDNE